MRRLTFIIVSAVLFSLSLSAQTVDEIIAKHIAAQGGMAKLKAVQSIRMTGEVDAGGTQAAFSQFYKRPMKMRLDISLQGLTLTQAYDGQKGWQIVPFTGKKDPEPVSGDDLKQMQEQADLDGPLVDYKQKGITVELVGNGKTAGAYHLKVTLKSGEVRELYVDAGTFLVTRAVLKNTVRGNAVELESTIGDYRDVGGGLMFPFSIEQHPVGGQGPAQKITFTTIEPNAPVEDSIFTMPAAAPPAAPAKAEPAPK